MDKLYEYRKHGRTFRLFQRMRNVAIFRCSELSAFSPFEVILIQSHNGREIAGRIVPPREYPPSDAQWGSKGWTFRTEEAAVAKFERLVAHELEGKSGE